MTSITQAMQANHRHCDELFAAAEASAAKNDWQQAEVQWQAFTSELFSHITDKEEGKLFPAIEAINGPMGPTQVMRGEHEQMRMLCSQIDEAIANQNSDQFLGLSETLMMLMQQHNMKEEQILYPMIERAVPDATHLIAE